MLAGVGLPPIIEEEIILRLKQPQTLDMVLTTRPSA